MGLPGFSEDQSQTIHLASHKQRCSRCYTAELITASCVDGHKLCSFVTKTKTQLFPRVPGKWLVFSRYLNHPFFWKNIWNRTVEPSGTHPAKSLTIDRSGHWSIGHIVNVRVTVQPTVCSLQSVGCSWHRMTFMEQIWDPSCTALHWSAN